MPTIVDATSRPACHHLIVFGDLILDDVADVGEGTLFFGNHPQVALAVRLLAGPQVVIDKVGGHHLLHCVQVSLFLCLQEAAHQYLVPLLSLRQRSFLSSCQLTFLYRVDPMSMMPPEGVRCMDQGSFTRRRGRYILESSYPQTRINPVRLATSPTVTLVRNGPLNTACRTLIEESSGCEDDQAALQGAENRSCLAQVMRSGTVGLGCASQSQSGECQGSGGGSRKVSSHYACLHTPVKNPHL